MMVGFEIVQEDDFTKAREAIKNIKEKKVVFYSSDDELNRKILEKEKISVFLLKLSGRKDRNKQRDSGFNTVMAKIAKKNNISIGINLDEIIESKSREKSEILSRVRQNISICNKNKINMEFICLDKKNQRDIYDLKALGAVLGMQTWMTKCLGKIFN